VAEEPQQPPPPDRWHNHLALWAGLTAFFGNMTTLAIIDFFGDQEDKASQATAALLTAFFVGMVVYSKQKWDDTKKQREAYEKEKNK
jgi:hypothetical protein